MLLRGACQSATPVVGYIILVYMYIYSIVVILQYFSRNTVVLYIYQYHPPLPVGNLHRIHLLLLYNRKIQKTTPRV